MSARRPSHLCRSWLFVNGAEEAALEAAPATGADVVMQELEDFTPPALRPKARELAPGIFERWRAAGVVVGVRVNPLDGDGLDDLAAVMRGRPHIVALPKVADPEHIARLDHEVATLEKELGIAPGSTELLPNIELARGLVQAGEIARTSPRVKAMLMASEDMAADLGAERAPDGAELAYARQRFLVECVAAGVTAVDCPYTWSDDDGAERDTKWVRRLGYKAKSAVAHSHAAIINRVLTPSDEEVARAQKIVALFEDAQARGEGRVELDGSLVETPTYTTALRLLKRADDLARISRTLHGLRGPVPSTG